MQAQVRVLEMIREALPGAILVGDSTQPVYAGNLYYDHDRPGGWFNAATGFGALGYAPPAAIGAALAAPGVPVVCLVGDGGFQFSLAEIGAAVDADVPVVFVVWNNRGYREIEVSMRERGIEPVGFLPGRRRLSHPGRAAGGAGGAARGAQACPRAGPPGPDRDHGGLRRPRWL